MGVLVTVLVVWVVLVVVAAVLVMMLMMVMVVMAVVVVVMVVLMLLMVVMVMAVVMVLGMVIAVCRLSSRSYFLWRGATPESATQPCCPAPASTNTMSKSTPKFGMRVNFAANSADGLACRTWAASSYRAQG